MNTVIFVVATAPQSGKTTVARLFSQLTGEEWAPSSRPVVERLERRLDLPAGTIDRIRSTDSERYRPELIEEGNRMAAEGLSPGLLSVRAGYAVIDGLRREKELAESRDEVLMSRRCCLIVCVVRPTDGEQTQDNTEAEGLLAQADTVLLNNGDLGQLTGKVQQLWRDYTSGRLGRSY